MWLLCSSLQYTEVTVKRLDRSLSPLFFLSVSLCHLPKYVRFTTLNPPFILIINLNDLLELYLTVKAAIQRFLSLLQPEVICH